MKTRRDDLLNLVLFHDRADKFPRVVDQLVTKNISEELERFADLVATSLRWLTFIDGFMPLVPLFSPPFGRWCYGRVRMSEACLFQFSSAENLVLRLTPPNLFRPLFVGILLFPSFCYVIVWVLLIFCLFALVVLTFFCLEK